MPNAVNHELSTEDQGWLKRLSTEIWQEHEDRMRANLSGHTWTQKSYTEKRKLTVDEWERVKRLIRAHELPCLPDGGTFGFGFSLTVCAHSIPGVKPETLVRITGEHLPGMENSGHRANWGQIWETFEPFTHSPRNRELLAFYGFEEPRNREHYEY